MKISFDSKEILYIRHTNIYTCMYIFSTCHTGTTSIEIMGAFSEEIF